MKALAALATAFALALVGLGAWRIVAGFEGWFDRNPAAGGAIMWSLVAALVLAVFAIPAAAWGLAARAWVVRLREGERLESHAHALLEAQQRLRVLERQGAALPAAHEPRALPGPEIEPAQPATIERSVYVHR